MADRQVKRVLIYRLGSLGDFVVALPCLHLIRRSFPDQIIGLLTNRPVDSRAAPAQSILDGSGLIDECITYRVGTRDLAELAKLRQEVRRFEPDVLVYLTSRATLPVVMRDYAFFRLAGVGRTFGFPMSADLRSCRVLAPDRWEAEAIRLTRCLAGLGDAKPQVLENWDLRLSAEELASVDQFCASLPEAARGMPLLGMSIGTKQPINDWGDDNWRAVLDGLADSHFGLVLIGAADESGRSEGVAKHWPGPVLNACGRLNPRQSAALLRRTKLFLCHDSGPMHLAAAVGTRCLAVFSKKNPPGQWYPYGESHQVFYPPSTADSILATQPAEVIAAGRGMLAALTVLGEG